MPAFPLGSGHTYTSDYFGNTTGVTEEMRQERGYEDGKNWDQPVINVFRKDGETVRHFWGNELVYVQEEPNQNHRALDTLDPVWGMLDLIPEGRGDFFPKLAYG